MQALLDSGDSLKLLMDTYLVHYHPSLRTLSDVYLRDTLLVRKNEIRELKSEIEIYIGIYLVAVWFMRRSHIFGIVMYFQMIRVKYMLGGLTAQACARIDRKIERNVMRQSPMMVK